MNAMKRELSDVDVEHQIEAYLARAARMPDPDFDAWLRTKDFNLADEAALRVEYARALNPQRQKDTA